MDIFRQLSKYLLPSNPLKPPIPEGMSLFPLSPIVPKNGLISEKLQDFFLSCIASPPFLCYHKRVRSAAKKTDPLSVTGLNEGGAIPASHPSTNKNRPRLTAEPNAGPSERGFALFRGKEKQRNECALT